MVLNTKTKIEDLSIGDMIPCRYKASSGVVGVFNELGTGTASEILTTGTATPDGKFNFIKVDKGLLIADRVVQTGISWDALNSAKYIEGKLIPDISDKLIISPSINSNTYEDVEITSTAGVGWQAFALNPTFYTYPISSPFEIVTKFMSGKVLNKLVLNNLNYTGDGVAGPVGSFKLYGSLNGLDFVELLAVSGIPNVVQKLTYTIDNKVAYTHYKFVVISAYGNYAGNFGRFGLGYYNIGDTLASKGIIRSLTGGNAYLGTDGNASLVDKGLGAWPPNNEWDKYMVKSDLGGKITPGNEAIWNINNLYSWVNDSSLNNTYINTKGSSAAGNSSQRINRGYRLNSSWDNFNFSRSSYADTIVGFRPVLEYPEDSRCTNIRY